MPTRQPAAASTLADVLEDGDPGGAGPARVVGAEQPADVAEPGRGQDGVGEGVGDDVAVGVPGAAVDARPVQPASQQARPGSIGWTSVPMPTRGRLRCLTCADLQLGQREVVGDGDLGGPLVARDGRDRDARGADHGGVVGEARASRRRSSAS